jgi:hypothetical protein
LEGFLKKLGVKGPRNTWKKRYFKQKGNKIYYYVSKSAGQEKGFMDLEEGKFDVYFCKQLKSSSC